MPQSDGPKASAVRMPPIAEPTAEQCEERAVLHDDGVHVWRACWYPQIGGYITKAVVAVERTSANACFDVYLYSDDKFPRERVCMEIHHCRADQFRDFADRIEAMQREAGQLTGGEA